MNKTTFIGLLEQARSEWEDALKQLNEQRMLQPGIEGSWSVKDLIAHVSWYEGEMVPVILQHVFTGSDWWAMPTDERNELIYQQNKERPLQEVVQDGRRSSANLLQAVQSLSDEDLNDANHFRDMPEDWIPWHIFAGNSYEHYQDHLPALRAWITQ